MKPKAAPGTAFVNGRPREVVCQIHPRVTVVHYTEDKCPLCALVDAHLTKVVEDAAGISRAIHAIATAPAPFAVVLEAVRAMEPITAQLKGSKGITAFGHTANDVIRLGEAQAALNRWLDGGGQ